MKSFSFRFVSVMGLILGLSLASGCGKSPESSSIQATTTKDSKNSSEMKSDDKDLKQAHIDQLKVDVDELNFAESNLTSFGIKFGPDYSIDKVAYFKFRLTSLKISIQTQNQAILNYADLGNKFLNKYNPKDSRNAGYYSKKDQKVLTVKINSVQQVVVFSEWMKFLYDNSATLLGWGTWTAGAITTLLGYFGFI
jgi:hypothetical protein